MLDLTPEPGMPAIDDRHRREPAKTGLSAHQYCLLQSGYYSRRTRPALPAQHSALSEGVATAGTEEQIVTSRAHTAQDFHDRLRSFRGAAVDLKAVLTQSTWFRPHKLRRGRGAPVLGGGANASWRRITRRALVGARAPVGGTGCCGARLTVLPARMACEPRNWPHSPAPGASS
jgi:hypothetical protein